MGACVPPATPAEQHRVGQQNDLPSSNLLALAVRSPCGGSDDRTQPSQHLDAHQDAGMIGSVCVHPLRRLHQKGTQELGAHLDPWQQPGSNNISCAAAGT